MNLKMRPMSEAPLNVPLLLADPNRPSGWTYGEFSARDSMHKFNGFFVLSDLLRAAEILAAITPEGCELLPELIHAPDDPKACISLHPDLHVRVKIRKLAPPVEYRYECEAEPREARIGDWIRSDDKWVEVKKFGFLREPRLCYTRREVKR